MNNNNNCIDKGTEFCPCHLSETGDCSMCSMLAGKDFCDCKNYGGVCIYGEYIWNGKKAKEHRKAYTSKIVSKKLLDKNVIELEISMDENITKELDTPGAYIFIRPKDMDNCFDTPMSVFKTNSLKNTISIVLQEKGIKTKILGERNVGEELIVRAPYFNGIFGIDNIQNAKNGLSILIGRGIGVAPLIPVMKKLIKNGNKITLINDRGILNTNIIEENIKEIDMNYYEMNLLSGVNLSNEIKDFLNVYLKRSETNLIVTEGADIINSLICDFVSDRCKLACSNNTKMCCGEGVCGACTITYEDDSVRRYCKEQWPVKEVYKGRRSL